MNSESVKRIAVGEGIWDFEITGIEIHSEEELLACMRKVPLMKELANVLPYEKAKLEIVIISPTVLVPPQFYVLKTELEKIIRLRQLALNHTNNSLDIFKMHGYARIRTDQGDYTIYPPVVEVSEPDGGILLINDGMHRIFLAKSMEMPINVLMIGGVCPDYPYYAMPNPQGWNGVKIVDEVPAIKKEYRVKDYRKLYRNFNIAFPDSTGSRENAKNSSSSLENTLELARKGEW